MYVWCKGIPTFFKNLAKRGKRHLELKFFETENFQMHFSQILPRYPPLGPPLIGTEIA